MFLFLFLLQTESFIMFYETGYILLHFDWFIFVCFTWFWCFFSCFNRNNFIFIYNFLFLLCLMKLVIFYCISTDFLWCFTRFLCFFSCFYRKLTILLCFMKLVVFYWILIDSTFHCVLLNSYVSFPVLIFFKLLCILYSILTCILFSCM